MPAGRPTADRRVEDHALSPRTRPSFSWKLHLLPSVLDRLPLGLPLPGSWEVTRGSLQLEDQRDREAGAAASGKRGSWGQGRFALLGEAASGACTGASRTSPARALSLLLPPQTQPRTSWTSQHSRRGRLSKVLGAWLLLSTTGHCHGEGKPSDRPVSVRGCPLPACCVKSPIP